MLQRKVVLRTFNVQLRAEDKMYLYRKTVEVFVLGISILDQVALTKAILAASFLAIAADEFSHNGDRTYVSRFHCILGPHG